MKIRPLFNKYQKELVQFANTGMGRFYLKTENLPVIGVHPDGITYLQDITDRVIKKSVFYSRSPYLNKFHRALEGLEIASDLISFKMFKDFGEIIIPHFQGLISYSKLPLLMRTDSTFNPDGHIEDTSVDGRAGVFNIDDTFSIMRASTSSLFSGDSTSEDNSPNVSASATSNQWAAAVRGIFLFDTNTLPDTDNITASVFSTKHTTKADGLSGDTDDGSKVVLVSSNPASNDGLVSGDGALSIYGTTDFGRGVTQTNIDVGGNYNDITLNANGLANISKTGISKFGIMYAFDFDDDVSTLVWASEASINYNTKYAEQATSTDRPQLVVTHELPVKPPGVGYRSLLGVGF